MKPCVYGKRKRGVLEMWQLRKSAVHTASNFFLFFYLSLVGLWVRQEVELHVHEHFCRGDCLPLIYSYRQGWIHDDIIKTFINMLNRHVGKKEMGSENGS